MNAAKAEAGAEREMLVVAASRWRFEHESYPGRWYYTVTLEGARGAKYDVSVVHTDGKLPLPFKTERSGRTTRTLGRARSAFRASLEEMARAFVDGCAA